MKFILNLLGIYLLLLAFVLPLAFTGLTIVADLVALSIPVFAPWLAHKETIRQREELCL